MAYSQQKNGERMRKLRMSTGKSTTEVANALHISESTLRAYENGARNPSDQVKIDIAKYYKVTVENLFFGR
jgi:DNA-binding XRE family transcriptional regulator